MLYRRRDIPALTAALALLAFSGGGCAHVAPAEAAESRLRREVREHTGFRRIRAVEYLGNAPADLPADSPDPKVRIGQLRVRYAGGDRAAAEPIRRAALSAGAPEQLHGLEAAAKCGIAFDGEDRAALRRIAGSDWQYGAGYANWILAAAGDAEALARLDAWIVTGGGNGAISAYAAGYLPAMPERRAEALKKRLASGTAGEQAFSLWALARHGKVDAAAVKKYYEKWRDRSEGTRRFALLAVGETGSVEDLPFLLNIMENGDEPEAANAAAAAILRISRRGSEARGGSKR